MQQLEGKVVDLAELEWSLEVCLLLHVEPDTSGMRAGRRGEGPANPSRTV